MASRTEFWKHSNLLLLTWQLHSELFLHTCELCSFSHWMMSNVEERRQFWDRFPFRKSVFFFHMWKDPLHPWSSEAACCCFLLLLSFKPAPYVLDHAGKVRSHFTVHQGLLSLHGVPHPAKNGCTFIVRPCFLELYAPKCYVSMWSRLILANRGFFLYFYVSIHIFLFQTFPVSPGIW